MCLYGLHICSLPSSNKTEKIETGNLLTMTYFFPYRSWTMNFDILVVFVLETSREFDSSGILLVLGLLIVLKFRSRL